MRINTIIKTFVKPLLALTSSAVVAYLIFSSYGLQAAEDKTAAKITSVTNPIQTFGVQIGDKLSRNFVLDIPAPFKIPETTFPKKGTKKNGVELVEVTVVTSQQKENTRYIIDLSYQAFINPSKPTVMHLPTETFQLTGGAKIKALEVPAWGFWLSPIVTGGIEIAQKNIQPEAPPPLVDASVHKTWFVVFASLLASSLLGLLYLNADGNWLPFMGGAFAKAHRQLKRLEKSSNRKIAVDEKQALVMIHQAFNQHYEANMFARDIEPFIAKRVSFQKMKAEIAQFFDESNQSLYAVKPRNSQKVIHHLVQLSKQLRDCERGV